MTSNDTILQILTFILGSGGVLALLLQRIPGFETLPSTLKFAIVSVVNILAPVILAALQIYIPPDVLNSTPAQLIAGVAALVVAFIVHKLDTLLEMLVQMAQAKTATMLLEYDDFRKTLENP